MVDEFACTPTITQLRLSTR